MNSTWQDYLIKAGASLENQAVLNFGAPELELAAVQAKTILTDLSHFGFITVSGEDAAPFLQGQFTNDIGKVNEARGQYSGYCSSKGRLLANFLILRHASEYLLQLPAELTAAIQKRLAMFVLRAKVVLHDHSTEWVRLGLAGVNADAVAGEFFARLPTEKLGTLSYDEITLIRLDAQRFEIIAPPDAAPALWEKLSGCAQPVGCGVWDWLNIRAGLPTITTATQDQFVPQMINFELMGGVDFKKGCYTGQEIVARTQYLGKLKRRLYLAHLESKMPPRAGDSLYSVEMGDQASGMIVNADCAPGGGYDLLASIQITSVATQTIRWSSLTGEALEIRELPYAV